MFGDRVCFTLVRPLNNDNDLRRLDQFPVWATDFGLSVFIQEGFHPHAFSPIVKTTDLNGGGRGSRIERR
ncbi:hypothetical protein L1987_75767 [Smallanthus sonchifolius]|uniref:Uncharacterized protein n=1 Tax=Smallanthus sonchifolius TaxID=185202 RepID=A0ACB9A825_9ASTR|nr:hypothetical protein L1987_75767 [Smallanthus sonchifolius]